MATAANAMAAVSNAVGMIGTKAGLSMQIVIGVKWCVSPINVLPIGCQPFPIIVFYLSITIDQLDD